MKLLLTALICFSVSTGVFAQYSIEKGDVLLDIGAGIWGNKNQYTSNNFSAPSWAVNPSSDLHYLTPPALSLVLQKSFWNDITLGIELAYNGFTREYDNQQANGYYQHSRLKSHNYYFMGRGEYHFNRILDLPARCDLYAGVIAGYRISTSELGEIYEGNNQIAVYQTNYPSQSSTKNGFDGGAFAGFRYKVKQSMFVYGELGYAITVFRGGVAWRF